jgi:hypothetical protein
MDEELRPDSPCSRDATEDALRPGGPVPAGEHKWSDRHPQSTCQRIGHDTNTSHPGCLGSPASRGSLQGNARSPEESAAAHSPPNRTNPTTRRSASSRRTTRGSAGGSSVQRGQRRPRRGHHLYPTNSRQYGIASARPQRRATRTVEPRCGGRSDRSRPQQVPRLQPRLVYDVITVRGRPIRSRIVALAEVPAECAPRGGIKQGPRRRVPRRYGSLFPSRWPIRNDRGNQVNLNRIRHFCSRAVKPPQESACRCDHRFVEEPT